MAKLKKSTKKFLTKKNGTSKLSETLSRRRKQNYDKKKWINKRSKDRPDHDPENEEQAKRIKVLSRQDAAECDKEENDDGLGDDDIDEDEDMIEESSDDEEEAALLLAATDTDSDDDEIDEEKYKKQIQELEKSDPEFFKYLKENDKSLLDVNFDDDNDDDEMLDQADEGRNQEENDTTAEEEGHRKVLTAEMIEEWKRKIVEQKSTKHLKQICIAFRNAIDSISGDDKTPKHSYTIEDPNVFNILVLACIQEVPDSFINHIYGHKVDTESATTSAIPSSKPKWPKFKILIKIHIKVLLAFFNHASDESMIDFALLCSEKMVGFVACFPKLCKDWIKVLMHQWAAGSSNLRVRAFLGVRKLALISGGMLDQCLKISYTTFIASCGLVNSHTITNLNFMLNCIVELCGMDESSAYYNAFVYIRQLAIQLRGALMSPTKEAYMKIYNWQFYYCLKLWSQVLSTHAAGCATTSLTLQAKSLSSSKSTTTLAPLIYPLVQIILGAIKLKPSSKYLPLRFNLIRILINISKSTGYYIPVASLLFEVFEMSDVKSKGMNAVLQPITWELSISIGKAYIGSRTFQNEVVDETVNLLFEYYSNLAMNIAFPEIALPTVLHLRKVMKTIATSPHHLQHNKTIQVLVEKLEENIKFIEKHRSGVDFGPNNTIQANSFLSNLDPSMSPLYKVNQV